MLAAELPPPVAIQTFISRQGNRQESRWLNVPEIIKDRESVGASARIPDFKHFAPELKNAFPQRYNPPSAKPFTP